MKAHFINNADNTMITKLLIDHVPRVNDELRFGGAGNEKFYTVTLVVFIYDEGLDRVNIGCDLAIFISYIDVGAFECKVCRL